MPADQKIMLFSCLAALIAYGLLLVMERINDWRNRRILRSYKNYSDDPFIIEPGQTVEFYGELVGKMGRGNARLVKMEIFDSEGKKIGSNKYTD